MTAVVTDVHYRMSLALIRDLAEAGVRVVCCERQGAGIPLGFSSRYVRRILLMSEAGWPEELYGLLRQLTEEDGARPALLPVGAATLAYLAVPEVRARFSDVCGLCIPGQEQLDAWNDKARTAGMARRLGIPVPESYAPLPGETPEDFSERVPVPCVIKPLCGEKQGLAAAQRYRIAASPAETAAGYRHFLSLTGEAPLVQTYLPGGGLGCSILADRGRVVAAISHRRVREYPVSGGPSSCCQCVDRPDLEQYAAAMAAEAGYTGLAMLEFKEGADGRPRLLEINPRVWGTFPLTRVTGSQISLLWCLLAWNEGNPALAKPLPEIPEPRRRRMQYALSDLAAAAGYLRRGEVRRACGALADGLRPSVRDGVWEFSDPKPGFLYYRSCLRRRKS